jgi:HAD superfamily hydrolase (TIGR01484 family)
MRPLAEAPLEDVAGLAFDVDDTLTTAGVLGAEAFDALWRLHRAGVPLVAVTGRPLGWADALASSWPVAVAVGENGAGWAWRRGRALARGYFHDDATRLEHAAQLEAVRARVLGRLPEIREASDQPARRCDLAYDVGETDPMAPSALDALLALIAEAGLRSAVSSVHAHVIPGAWDKAAGVLRALEAVGLARGSAEVRDGWLFVGDSGNDAAAFSFFARSVGVANVRENLARLPDPPGWVTRAERGAGFVELADALLEARGG